MLTFDLNPALDVAALRAGYAAQGRVQIVNFLGEACARALLDNLAHRRDWLMTYNRGDKVHDIRRDSYAQIDTDMREGLGRAIVAGGRDAFQFCYDTVRQRADMPADDPLAAFTAFLNSAPMLDLLRTITAADDVARVDGHASRYAPGQFLTTHDDHIEAKGRRAAYVMNLTPRWRPDWGGLLLFYDRLGNVTRGYTPGFNMLNLFAVPQAHAVSWVTPLAAVPRFAVTGWLLGAEEA